MVTGSCVDESMKTPRVESPENCVIFVTGPCAGTPVPSSGRTAVVVGFSTTIIPDTMHALRTSVGTSGLK